MTGEITINDETAYPRQGAPMNGSFMGRGRNYLTLLACPVDDRALALRDGALHCADDPAHVYPFEDGILRLATPEQRTGLDAQSAEHEARCTAEGWHTPDEAGFKSLPQTALNGFPATYWPQQAAATALLWRYLEAIRLRNGTLPIGPMGEAAVIGAGMGWLAYGLDVAGFTTIALDALAGPRHGLAVYPIARYLRVQADPLDPPLARGAYDLLVYQDGLARSADESTHAAALQAGLRALRPGGWVAVMNPLEPTEAQMAQVLGLFDDAGLDLMAEPQRRGWRARLIDVRDRLTGRDGDAPPVLVAQKAAG